MAQLLEWFKHLDKHLIELIAQYGNSVYLILAGIIFAETAVVIFPFLPGTRCCSQSALSRPMKRKG